MKKHIPLSTLLLEQKLKDIEAAMAMEQTIMTLQHDLEQNLERLLQQAHQSTDSSWLVLLNSQKDIAVSACGILRSLHKQRMEWVQRREMVLRERLTQDRTCQDEPETTPINRIRSFQSQQSSIQSLSLHSSPSETLSSRDVTSKPTNKVDSWLAQVQSDWIANDQYSLLVWFQSSLQPTHSEPTRVISISLDDIKYQKMRVHWRDGIPSLAEELLEQADSQSVLFVTSAVDDDDDDKQDNRSFTDYWFQLSCTSEWTQVEQRGGLTGPWTRSKLSHVLLSLWKMIQQQYAPLQTWIDMTIKTAYSDATSFAIWYQPPSEFGVFDDDNSCENDSQSISSRDRHKRYMFGPSFDRLFNGTCMVVVSHQLFRTVGGLVFKTGKDLAHWMLEQYPESSSSGSQEPRSLYVSRNWNVQTHTENDPRVFWEDYVEELEHDWPQIQQCCRHGPIGRQALEYILDQLLHIPKEHVTPRRRSFPDSVRKRIDRLKSEKGSDGSMTTDSCSVSTRQSSEPNTASLASIPSNESTLESTDQ